MRGIPGVAALCFFLVLAGCGDDGGGGASDPGTGSSLNDGWEVTALDCGGTVTGGTFSTSSASVYVKAGELSSCAKSTQNPVLSSTSALPAGFDITTSEGDANVTAGGAGYTFTINGDRGFDTTTDGAVTITLPFDTTAVPAADQTSLKVFVRIFNAEDNSVVDLAGILSGGQITVDSRGLPQEFTAAVIYNPNMDQASSISVNPSISVGAPDNTITALKPWPARKWCVVYNAASASLIAAVKSADIIAGTPTTLQLQTAVQNYVAISAANNQTTFEAANFRAPNLYIASKAAEPCGTVLGTTPRYNIHLKDGATKFTSDDVTEVVSPSGNHFGRLYISPDYIANPVTHPLGSIRSIIGHEMLHAIQNGYELLGATLIGYREGTATLFEMTINNGGTIAVRSYSAGETKLLSDYLAISARGGTGTVAYANQDFFAYVGSKYNGGSLSFLSGLFEKMHTDIAAQAASSSSGTQAAIIKQPPRDTLLGAMDSYFQSSLSTPGTLKDIFLDFLRQRVFDHNTASQLGRTGETIAGFAVNLFQTSTTSTTNSINTAIINADDCSMGGASGTFGKVAPLAARAIRVTTGTTTTTGRKITIVLKPASGTIGDTFAGYSSWKGATAVLAASNDFTSFGTSATDEIDIAVANVTRDKSLSIDYEIVCDSSSSGSSTSSGSNHFTFTQFSAAETFTPVSGLGRANAIVVGSTSDVNTKPNMIVFFNSTITGPGTYTLSLYNSPADLQYYTSGIHTFHQTGGTLTLTAYGTNTGDHMTGTFSMNIADDTAAPNTRTGIMGAVFDFIVGDQNSL